MSDKQYKRLRKAIKNVTQDLLPQILVNETVAAIEKTVTAHVNQRLDGITQHVKTTLDKIDERSKDVQSYVVRNAPIEQAPQASPIDVITKT